MEVRREPATQNYLGLRDKAHPKVGLMMSVSSSPESSYRCS